MTTRPLSRRELNRATLARQFLLSRTDRSVPDVIEHLVGLQAQTPHTWYTGLWTRIAGFSPEVAADGLVERTLVRMAVMRSTIHLVTARDAGALRALVQPVLDRDLFTNHTHKAAVRDLDLDAVTTAGRELLAERPRTQRELGALLHQRWPDRPPAGLAYAVRNLVPLVQVPPRGLWGRSGSIAHTTAEAWLGGLPDGGPPDGGLLDRGLPGGGLDLAGLVRRYLGAFGPATVRDLQTWSGLTRLSEVVDSIRGELLVLRDEDDRELFDLPQAPRPDADTPAPPRYLYDFDNLLLSHADRSRVITGDFQRYSFRPHGPVPSVVLIDGVTGGDWTIERTGAAATLHVRTYRRLSTELTTKVVTEGAGLLAFAAADADRHDVQVRVVPD
ncbi:winged helix DNA-binding domain-containing protein [Kribbella sp. CA-253562]|uniref:winged helix DNA-binding domain-containing protein n=1 Tax=Kribbella sp. CA-253562 TaxID=3239942 RepID=UPI003D8B3154